MQKKKIVFFDIDGTIWNQRNEIPPSTVRAIHTLNENGNLAFLCSGRSRGYIRNPKLLEIGFDGIVSGCGTMIEYGEETVFYHRIDNKLVEDTIHTVRRFGFRPILEGREYLYMDNEEFGDDYFGKKLRADAAERLRTISGEWGKWEVSKLSCATDHADREGCFEAMKEHYDFMIHNPEVVEFVPKGYDKGTGMKKVCELLGTELSDTIAFGDSVNDLGMIRTAGIGVAMGNGSAVIKEAADYVTTSLTEDGIWNGCRRLGLI